MSLALRRLVPQELEPGLRLSQLQPIREQAHFHCCCSWPLEICFTAHPRNCNLLPVAHPPPPVQCVVSKQGVVRSAVQHAVAIGIRDFKAVTADTFTAVKRIVVHREW